MAEIVAVAAVWQVGRQVAQCLMVDVRHAIRNLFGAGDLQPLSLLDGLDEQAGLQQRAMRTCVEPGRSAAKGLDVEVAPLKVF